MIVVALSIAAGFVLGALLDALPRLRAAARRRPVSVSELRPGDTYRDHRNGPLLTVTYAERARFAEDDMVTIRYEERVDEWATAIAMRMRLSGTMTVSDGVTVLDHDTSDRWPAGAVR